MPGSVIVGGARTPIGKLSGALKSFSAMDLGGFAIDAALRTAGITGDQVDYVIMGHVIQAGAGQITARQAAVKGGIPMTRARADGQQGLPVRAERDRDGRPADRLRPVRHRRRRWHGVDDQRPVPAARRPRRLPLRRQQDRRRDRARRPVLRVRPARHGRLHRLLQQAAQASPAPSRTSSPRCATSGPPRRRKNGLFDDEIVNVEVPQRKGDPLLVSDDEGVRPGTTAESLAKLRPAFAADGTVTAGSASQISDGAAAVVVMSPGQGRGARRADPGRDRRARHGRRTRPVAAVPAVQRDPQGARPGRA